MPRDGGIGLWWGRGLWIAPSWAQGVPGAVQTPQARIKGVLSRHPRLEWGGGSAGHCPDLPQVGIGSVRGRVEGGNGSHGGGGRTLDQMGPGGLILSRLDAGVDASIGLPPSPAPAASPRGGCCWFPAPPTSPHTLRKFLFARLSARGGGGSARTPGSPGCYQSRSPREDGGRGGRGP